MNMLSTTGSCIIMLFVIFGILELALAIIARVLTRANNRIKNAKLGTCEIASIVPEFKNTHQEVNVTNLTDTNGNIISTALVSYILEAGEYHVGDKLNVKYAEGDSIMPYYVYGYDEAPYKIDWITRSMTTIAAIFVLCVCITILTGKNI